MLTFSRRRFLASTAAAAAMPSALLVGAPEHHATEDFAFIFLTDTHTQPELDAAKGTSMAFKKANGIHADFAIQGGDHIMDALGVPTSRSLPLFHQYAEIEQQLGLKVYHTIGNHDVIGLYPASGMQPNDPLYGKTYFTEHIGPLHQSFNHKGVHFILLDSIGFTPERGYYGLIDPAQKKWLADDLAGVAPSTPVIVVSHIPVISAFSQYLAPTTPPAKYDSITVSNAFEIVPIFKGHNVLAVLQGHTHVNERVDFQGVSYITSGAVSGNWWKGTHLGTPEGFTVCTVRGGKLETRYETYGFHSVAPENT